MNPFKYGHRTPRWLLILKVAQVPWMTILFLGILGGMIPGVNVLILVIVTVAVMMYVFSFICRLFGWLFYRNDPGYKQFLASGGDPYFDFLPSGVNNDSWAVRCGGKPEPETEFIPPKDWLIQCNSCGARNQFMAGPCWHCGNILDPMPDHSVRTLLCPNCRQLVAEATYGDFDNGGVICPYCQTHMVSPV